MPRLIIIYDRDHDHAPTIKSSGPIVQAHIPVKDGLKNHDIYTLARKLAEMLLENLPPEEEEIKF